MSSNDEAEERRRQQRERARMSLVDRLHGEAPRTTKSGMLDQRSMRRTGRAIQYPLRVHPRTKAMLDAIRQRDGYPSNVVMLEAFLETYQQVHGALDASLLPTDEELIEMIEAARDKDDE